MDAKYMKANIIVSQIKKDFKYENEKAHTFKFSIL